MKISQRQVWLWSLIVAGVVIAGVGVWYWEMERVESGEHIAHVDWLPEDARNICYYRSHTFTAAEFLISEEGFLKWCKTQGFAPAPIVDKPFKVERYSLPAVQAQLEASGKGLTSSEQQGAAQASYEAATRKIMHGLFFKQQKGREIIFVGYDSDVGAVFYTSRRM